MRRARTEESAREQRRAEILDTLRKLKEDAGDPAAQAAAERLARRKDVLDRYPPLY